MVDRTALKALLERHEGLRLHPYRDTVGKLTLGIGRNLDDVGISREEAFTLLDHDIDRVIADLDQHLSWWNSLNPTRQLVLCDMCFNLGIGSLLGFKNTLSAMQEGRFTDAAKGMLESKWHAQVGSRAERLAHMMETG